MLSFPDFNLTDVWKLQYDCSGDKILRGTKWGTEKVTTKTKYHLEKNLKGAKNVHNPKLSSYIFLWYIDSSTAITHLIKHKRPSKPSEIWVLTPHQAISNRGTSPLNLCTLHTELDLTRPQKNRISQIAPGLATWSLICLRWNAALFSTVTNTAAMFVHLAKNQASRGEGRVRLDHLRIPRPNTVYSARRLLSAVAA